MYYFSVHLIFGVCFRLYIHDLLNRSVADYLSKDLPYKLSANDICLTVGAHHAIEVVTSVLARPGANILLPRPGYPFYEARAMFSNIEVRNYNLLPEKGWEIDLDGVDALADANTVAIVLINPGNPCGNVYTYEHLKKVGYSIIVWNFLFVVVVLVVSILYMLFKFYCGYCWVFDVILCSLFCQRLQRLQKGLEFLSLQMKFTITCVLEANHLCQEECLDLLHLFLPLGPYQRDGLFQVGGWVG